MFTITANKLTNKQKYISQQVYISKLINNQQTRPTNNQQIKKEKGDVAEISQIILIP